MHSMFSLYQLDCGKFAGHPDVELLLKLLDISNRLNAAGTLYKAANASFTDQKLKVGQFLQIIRQIASIFREFFGLMPGIEKAPEIWKEINTVKESADAFCHLRASIESRDPLSPASIVLLLNDDSFLASCLSNASILEISSDDGKADGLLLDEQSGSTQFLLVERLIAHGLQKHFGDTYSTEHSEAVNLILKLNELSENVKSILAVLSFSVMQNFASSPQAAGSTLDVLQLCEEERYRELVTLVPKELEILEDISGLYRSFISVAPQFSNITEPGFNIFLAQMIIGSFSQLHTGMLSLLRGHSADSKSFLRKSIEFSLFAANAMEVPKAYEYWYFAGKDVESYQAYRKHFNIMDMLSVDCYSVLDSEKNILERLIARYETCCVQVHATVVSTGPIMKAEQNDQGALVQVFHVDRLNHLDVIQEFAWVLDAHLTILSLYAHIMKKCDEAFDFDMWVSAGGPIRIKLMNLTDERKPLLYPDGLPQENRFWDIPKPKRKRSVPKPKAQDTPE